MNEPAERGCACNQATHASGHPKPAGDAAVLRPPFILNGVQFDLGHLAPIRLLCPHIGADGPALVIDVRFSHHAYTVSTREASATAAAHLVTERGDPRMFDVVRWQQSRDYLPGMIASLPTARVEFNPEKRNYRYALKGRLEDGQEYALFFSLKRSIAAGHDLHMTVESAYAVPVGSRGRPPGEIRFGVLALKTLRGEVISTPPRR